jgi:hypothetical protein
MKSKSSNSVLQQATLNMHRQDTIATHTMVRDLCRRIAGVGHKLYMDNFFSSPDLFDVLLEA